MFILKLKNAWAGAKQIVQYSKQIKQAGKAINLPEMRLTAQQQVAQIPENLWTEMSNTIFRQKGEPLSIFNDRIKFIRSHCAKTGTAIPEDVSESLALLEQKSNIFATRLNRSISRGIEPQYTYNYGEKFANKHSEHMDKVKNFVVKLEETAKSRWEQVPRTEGVLKQELGDEWLKLCKIDCDFRYLDTDNLVNLKIGKVSDEVIHSGQTFYHGTGKATAIQKEGFSLLPKPHQAATSSRELGEGVYLTPNRKVASHYAGACGNVMHLDVNLKKVAAVNNDQLMMMNRVIKLYLKESGIEITQPAVMEQIIKELFTRNGFNAVYTRNALSTGEGLFGFRQGKIIDAISGGKQSQLVVFNPEDISILNKSFTQRLQNQKDQVVQALMYPFRYVKNV